MQAHFFLSSTVKAENHVFALPLILVFYVFKDYVFSWFFFQPSLNKIVTLCLILAHGSCFPDFQSSLDYSLFETWWSNLNTTLLFRYYQHKIIYATQYYRSFLHFCHSSSVDWCSAVSVYNPFILFCGTATLLRVSSSVFIRMIFLTLNCSLSFYTISAMCPVLLEVNHVL